MDKTSKKNKRKSTKINENQNMKKINPPGDADVCNLGVVINAARLSFRSFDALSSAR
jgi:hypothetical protein